jgi:hypothetical protein
MPMDYLGWFLAGIFSFAFFALWFSTSYREVTKSHGNLQVIGDELHKHRLLLMQERGGENDTSAQKNLDSKRIAYREASKDYKKILENPMNRLVVMILNFGYPEEV